MNVARDITLRYLDGCPNWQVAEARLEEALERVGQTAAVSLEQVETPEEAQVQGFRGSPTVLIDGRDPFDASGPPGLSCRVYRTGAGVEGAPSVEELVNALKEDSQLA